MKVLLINGSPRKNGNTGLALAEVAKTLQTAGAETEIAWIGNKPIRGCIACAQCAVNGEGRCVFDDDVCNEMIARAAEADAYAIGTPVYYAGAAGSLISLLDRMFYAGGSVFRFKPAAAVAVARRAGTTTAIDQITKYFQINCMPLVSSTYWCDAFGRTEGEVTVDEEGMHTMRTLGRNMAWMMRCFEAARAAGIGTPEVEEKRFFNFVR